ncbi:cell division protein ZapA [Novosphingobium sp. UBA1939]|uniref:cell division protein ZapA n=1 Tax=Novosphingobium sp. UBA1939 TaxID=1946982 RepID=UPI0025D48E1C|nr:cell division protein ZapA [Novosphingobium sp. UBA1939]
MSNVSLQIGGRPFTVACAEGEEAHLEMLGRMIDERVRKLGAAAGQSESRMMLYAALFLADELHEEHRKAPPPAGEAPPAEAPASVVARVQALAERVEKLAQQIEQPS